MNPSQVMTTPAVSGIRAANIALWALQGLLAAFFGFAGINKLLGLQPEMLEQFARMGPGPWFRCLVGTLELVGAIALVTPRLAALGALWLAGIMVGAAFTHLFVLPPVYLAIGPLVLAIVLGLIARSRWPR